MVTGCPVFSRVLSAVLRLPPGFFYWLIEERDLAKRAPHVSPWSCHLGCLTNGPPLRC
jgi:hypothetical protein